MYAKGTSAFRYDFAVEKTPIREKPPVKRAARRKKAAVSKKKIVLSMAGFCLTVFLMIYQSAITNQEFEKLTALRNRATSLDAQMVEKQMRLEGMLDLESVEKTASERLGMQRPDKSQMVYLAKREQDRGQVLAKGNASVNPVSAFINQIGVILEYLY